MAAGRRSKISSTAPAIFVGVDGLGAEGLHQSETGRATPMA